MEDIFYKNFDIDFYTQNNKDLSKLSTIEIQNHYYTKGLKEGRLCSQGQIRSSYNKLPEIFEKCLEIGPFDNPLLIGKNVDYFEILQYDQLVERAKMLNRNYENIPRNIKWINRIGDLSIINDKYDLVLSSHVIEHSIDLIEHLKNVEKLLNSGGFYICIIPDKRFCFDHFINQSTMGDVIERHVKKNTNHTLKSYIEASCLTTHNDANLHWSGEHGQIELKDFQQKIEEYDNLIKSGKYIDIHAWQFTPDSFRDIIVNLNHSKLINLEIDRLYYTLKYNNDFITILKKVSN